MRPIPIEGPAPEGCRKVVIAAPDGDLTNEDILPVEAIITDDEVCIRMILEEEDLRAITEGKSEFWYCVMGHRIAPFRMVME